MKDIHQDIPAQDNSRDIFSSSDRAAAWNKTVNENKKAEGPNTDRPVRPVRQAPPPIRKPSPVPPAMPMPVATYPPQPVFPGQPGYYPQPVYYQPDPTQPPVPVYYAPFPGQPVQGQPIIPDGQAPYYPPMPSAEAVPYPTQPSALSVNTAESKPEPPSQAPVNDAGTRVLYQSEDFNKKEDAFEDYETLPHDFSYNPVSFDVSEVELPSKKPKKKAPQISVRPVSFKIDEMEIGTYELGIMTAGQNARSTTVELPAEETDEPEFYTEEATDEDSAFFDELSSNEIYSSYPDENKDENEDEDETEETEESVFRAPAPEIKVAVNHTEETGKKLSSKEIIRRAVLAVSCFAIVFACFSLFNEYRLHKQNKDLMSDISNLIITEAPSETTESTTLSDEEEHIEVTSPEITIPTTTRPLTPEEQWDLLKSENPDLIFPENMQLKYAKLYAQNPDFVAYLYADGSELDSPIVQGVDDEEYIEKNFYGEYTKYACPFVTSRNTIESLDMNTVIYGHHMRDGSIFACLDQYRTLEGYKEAPVISYNTIYQDYQFKVIATMITNINPSSDNGYVFNYFWTNLNNELNYNAYLNALSQRSLYDTGVDVLPTDKLITLSTCCNDFDDARLVVVARLVRPGESAEVDTSRAVVNDNPRFPQAYYSANGMQNPYANAYKWKIS